MFRHEPARAVTVGILLLFAAPALIRADEEPDWRAKALALNNVTGNTPIKAEIDAIVAKPEDAKKLLAAAKTLAAEKDQPLNYNAAYILGTAALKLKDAVAAKTFYLICLDQGLRLRSAQQAGPAYEGLDKVLDLLKQNKQLDLFATVCQELIETLEHAGSEEASERVLRRWIQALIQQKKTKEAEQLVDRLIKIRPGWRGLVIKAELQQESDKLDLAAETYQRALELIAKDDEIKAADKKKLVANIRSVLGGLYENSHPDKALEQFEELVKEYPKENSYKRQLIRALARMAKKERARKLLAELPKTDWQNIELKGSLDRDDGKFADAAKSYENVLEMIGTDKSIAPSEKKDLLTEVHYLLSGIYVDADDIDRAAQELQLLLKDNPDNPAYNNDLGYIWADHDMHLDKAEKMIRKAIEEDKKKNKTNGDEGANAAYLDSLGWVLFKQGKFAEARPFLEKAVQTKEGRHVEIYDHLGEVNLALGQKKAAEEAWRKGIEAAGKSRREQERKTHVEKKLKQLQNQ
jgi:tetratricopeptide (TPR) repeat protein